MSLPEPVPGLVIAYDFLWRRQARAGRENGEKTRPCVIVVAVHRSRDATTVVVSPITHSPPGEDEVGVAMPAATKRRLGLDSEPSWIIASEANTFTWPGPDIRPASGDDRRRYAYGHLPNDLMRQLREKVRAVVLARRLKMTERRG